MKTDNNRNRNFINMHFIPAMALLSLVVMAPLLTSQEQQSLGQQQRQQTNNTAASTIAASNQSAAASSSANLTANVTAAEGPGSVLKLSQANVALDIPMMKGYENGHEIFFIATDASDNQTAAAITNQTGFKVNVAPVLTKAPEPARTQAYGFTNGIHGNGPFGFQLPVVAAKPGDQGYSSLW